MGKTITLRVEDDISNTLRRSADGDRRTISNFIEYAAINYIFNNNVVNDNEMNELVSFKKGIEEGNGGYKKGTISFFKTLKGELETLEGKHAAEEVRQSVFMYVEACYNSDFYAFGTRLYGA
jgi:predicted transcriptional regulator